MNKFPVLSIFRGIANLIGGIIVLGGTLLALLSSQSYYGFNFGAFLPIFITALLLGGSIIIYAELIKLLIRVEDHLDLIKSTLADMRRMQKTQMQTPASASTSSDWPEI